MIDGDGDDGDDDDDVDNVLIMFPFYYICVYLHD